MNCFCFFKKDPVAPEAYVATYGDEEEIKVESSTAGKTALVFFTMLAVATFIVLGAIAVFTWPVALGCVGGVLAAALLIALFKNCYTNCSAEVVPSNSFDHDPSLQFATDPD